MEATLPGQIERVRTLLIEYQQGLGLDLEFQGFTDEVRGLPGPYAPPMGRLWLALADGESAGCVALKSLQDGAAEIKRLYVRPALRGRSAGRALAVTALEQARTLGYRSVCLDTLPSMESAQALYRKLGFRPIPPYYNNPLPGAVFLGMQLQSGGRR